MAFRTWADNRTTPRTVRTVLGSLSSAITIVTVIAINSYLIVAVTSRTWLTPQPSTCRTNNKSIASHAPAVSAPKNMLALQNMTEREIQFTVHSWTRLFELPSAIAFPASFGFKYIPALKFFNVSISIYFININIFFNYQLPTLLYLIQLVESFSLI